MLNATHCAYFDGACRNAKYKIVVKLCSMTKLNYKCNKENKKVAKFIRVSLLAIRHTIKE